MLEVVVWDFCYSVKDGTQGKGGHTVAEIPPCDSDGQLHLFHIGNMRCQ